MMYSKEVEETVAEIYDRKQADARFIADERRKKIYKEIPEIEKIEKTIGKIGVKLALSSVKGINYSPEEDISLLGEKRNELLQKHGYPADYLTNVFFCSKCMDKGYIDGKMCDCMVEEYRKQSIAVSNIAPALMNVKFEDFDINYYSEETDEKGNVPRKQIMHILDCSEKFMENFGRTDNKNILFYGKAGLGKTFLSAAIAGELYKRGYSVLYYSAKQLLTMMTDYDFGRIPEKKEICEFVFNADLLIIDDLGSEQQTSFSASTLFDIINRRMISGKQMIINTNLSGKDLRTLYSDRIFSRINEFEPLKFIGEDIRVLKNR